MRENAEDGDTRGWSVYDADPAGATVSNVFDSTAGSRVIALAGAGRGNGFLVGGTGATSGGWNDRANTVLSWRMNAAEGFRAYVALDTARGFRYLQYDPGEGRALEGIYARIGIGQVPATWRTYTRDLAADLASVEPGNAILAVHGLLLRGNLRIDDVALGRATGGGSGGGTGPVPNRPPVAVAGEDRAATRGRPLRLDGSASDDPDGRIASWRWSDAGGATLATSPAFDWTPTASGVQTLTLRVTDDRGTAATDTVQVRVAEPTGGGTGGGGGGALVREDAEDGSTDGWSVYDDDPAGARIANVFDAGAGSRVIDLVSAGVANGFRFEGGWNDAGRTRFSWRMSSSGDAVLYVGVDTTRGFRYLQYDTRGFTGPNGIYLRQAIERPGAGWRSYARDLAADVRTLEPGNALVAVQGLFVRGRLRLDDVAFGAPRSRGESGGGGDGTGGGGAGATVRWDAEDGATTAWAVYDDTPVGARIENVVDAAAGSRVVRLAGSGTANGFRLGGTGSGGGSWNDAASEVLSWRMDSPGAYVAYVAVRTTKGFRYLTYSPGTGDRLNGIYVQRGLGTTGAGWRTYTRNLASDLAAVDPGNELVSVEGLFVRGSLGLDDVITRAR